MTVHSRQWWEDAEPYDAETTLADLIEQRRLDRDLQNRLNAAAFDVQRANAAYDEALRRVRCAPHGTTTLRRTDLRVANARILEAELRYAELRRHEPQ